MAAPGPVEYQHQQRVLPLGLLHQGRVAASSQLTQSLNLTNEYALRTQTSYGQPLFSSKLNLNAGPVSAEAPTSLTEASITRTPPP